MCEWIEGDGLWAKKVKDHGEFRPQRIVQYSEVITTRVVMHGGIGGLYNISQPYDVEKLKFPKNTDHEINSKPINLQLVETPKLVLH